jgi:hypothetical protein
VIVREEMREHTHIIGTTGEGKSKLLENLIRHDIDQGHGVCFLDPSDRGDTLYNVLRYCFAKRVKKVLLIDPYHYRKFDKVPVINPFHSAYRSASVSNVMETIKTVFGTKDTADTPRIQRYLPAILTMLWNAKGTIRDSVWFTQKIFSQQRDQIYERLDPYNTDALMIEDAYRTRFSEQYLQSTINRLQPFYDDALELIFGGREGINFAKLVAEGWVVLVNLYSGFGFSPVHSRLVGASIINEILFAIDRLKNPLTGRDWKGRFHLYIDEAGRYATRSLADALAYKGKSGLRVTVAHQYYDQFEDEYVLNAVDNLCKTKIAFYIPNRDDRDRFVRNAFGGDLADRDVSYVLSGQKKQYAVVKKGKLSPHIIRIKDVPPVNVSQDLLNHYINYLYQNEWYKSPQSIRDGFNRFNRPISRNTKSSKPGAKPHRKANNDPDKAGPKSIFDD